MPLTPSERVARELEAADNFALPLEAERSQFGDPRHAAGDKQLRAAQGEAMRKLIYHCTEALCAALEDHAMETRPH